MAACLVRLLLRHAACLAEPSGPVRASTLGGMAPCHPHEKELFTCLKISSRNTNALMLGDELQVVRATNMSGRNVSCTHLRLLSSSFSASTDGGRGRLRTVESTERCLLHLTFSIGCRRACALDSARRPGRSPTRPQVCGPRSPILRQTLSSAYSVVYSDPLRIPGLLDPSRGWKSDALDR